MVDYNRFYFRFTGTAIPRVADDPTQSQYQPAVIHAGVCRVSADEIDTYISEPHQQSCTQVRVHSVE